MKASSKTVDKTLNRELMKKENDFTGLVKTQLTSNEGDLMCNCNSKLTKREFITLELFKSIITQVTNKTSALDECSKFADTIIENAKESDRIETEEIRLKFCQPN